MYLHIWPIDLQTRRPTLPRHIQICPRYHMSLIGREIKSLNELRISDESTIEILYRLITTTDIL